MKLEELADELNKLVAEGKGRCSVGLMITKRSPTENHPYIEDYQILEVVDEAIEAGSISIRGTEWGLLSPFSNDATMLP